MSYSIHVSDEFKENSYEFDLGSKQPSLLDFSYKLFSLSNLIPRAFTVDWENNQIFFKDGFSCLLFRETTSGSCFLRKLTQLRLNECISIITGAGTVLVVRLVPYPEDCSILETDSGVLQFRHFIDIKASNQAIEKLVNIVDVSTQEVSESVKEEIRNLTMEQIEEIRHGE